MFVWHNNLEAGIFRKAKANQSQIELLWKILGVMATWHMGFVELSCTK